MIACGMKAGFLSALSIAALLSALVVPSYGAPLPSPNLVKNPGAEKGPGATNEVDHFAPPRWPEIGGNFTAVQYGASGGFPSVNHGQNIGGGMNFFAGGPDPGFENALATQPIDLSRWREEIAAGKVRMELSGYLGGYLTDRDRMHVSALLLTKNGNQVPPIIALPTVTAEDRNNKTRLLFRSRSLDVDPTVRSMRVDMFAKRINGSYNDAYADRISVRLLPD
jgi:hypothetical protein